MMRLAALLLLAALLFPVAVVAQTETPTATPTATPTPTAIPAVDLELSSLITSTTELSVDLVEFSGDGDGDGGMYVLLFLAAIVIGFWLFFLIKEIVSWYRADYG